MTNTSRDDVTTEAVVALYDSGLTIQEISEKLDCGMQTVKRRFPPGFVFRSHHSRMLERFGNTVGIDWDAVRELALTLGVPEIAVEIGHPNAEQLRVAMVRRDIPRRTSWSGDRNPAWKGGRTWANRSYIAIYVPNHPVPAQNATHRLEHRLVMEAVLERYLLREEVVDHKNGCTTWNNPRNLQVFPDNATHLEQTLTGRKKVSQSHTQYPLDGPTPTALETGAAEMLQQHPLFPFPGQDMGLGHKGKQRKPRYR